MDQFKQMAKNWTNDLLLYSPKLLINILSNQLRFPGLWHQTPILQAGDQEFNLYNLLQYPIL